MKFSIKVIFLTLLMSNLAYAQTASILPPAKTTFFDQNGNPLTAGTIDSYVPGTTTRKTTWQDAAETIPNANPVTLDAAGRALILGSGSYRQIVKDRNGNLIWDQVTASAGSSSGGGGTGDGVAVGTIQAYAGLVAPTNYAFTYGQELNRTTYSALLAAITLNVTATCISGNPTITGFTDTSQIVIGAAVEGACVAASSTVISKTSSTITLNNNAIIGVTSAVTVFNFGNGNASTTFNVPDLRGYGVVGRCNMGGASCSNLTSTYFTTDPNSLGAKGGSQSTTLLAANLPPYTPTGTVVTTAPVFTDPTTFFGGVSTGGGAIAYLASNTGASGQQFVGTPFHGSNAAPTSTFTGTPAAGQISTPISRVQPSETLNYIIKIIPDTTGGGGGSGCTSGCVTSIGGQTGSISLSGLTMVGNTLTSAAFTSQNANLVFAGPSTGVPATPTFRSLVLADLPALGTMATQNATAVAIIGGTVSGVAQSGGTISGTAISSGTISGAAISSGTVSGAAISAGTIASAAISGATITASTIASTPINASGANITNVVNPTNAGDAANKSYVDSVAGTGINPLPQSRLATAAVLPNTPTYANGALGVGATLTAGANSTLTVDGTITNLNDVVLVKNQASTFQNGVYTVTTAGSGAAAWVLTRATYFDQAAEMKNNSFTAITAGSTNINSTWIMSPAVATVGTDPSTWTLNSSSSAGGITIGTTTVAGGATGKVIFDNAGIAGEYSITGTAGNVVMSTSPTIASPTFSGTVAGANTIPNSVLQQAAAVTLKGNPTSSTANVQDFTLSGLTARTTPDVTNDQLLIYNSASGAFNKISPTALGIGGGGVTSIAGNTGAFTLNSSKGLTNSTNSLQTTFTQTGTGAVATDLVTKAKQPPVTPWDFTSATIDDGTTSAVAAIQAALNTGRDVYLPKPATCYLVNSDLSMTGGQEIFGDGRGVPTICAKSNSFTLGMFVCSGSQPGNTFRDFGITYTQPNPSTGTVTAMRATLTQYLPVWSCAGSPRVSIRHMYVQNAWNGGNFVGNSGGLEVIDLQMSAYGYGISIDGSLDTNRITDFHFWPFGLTTNQGTVFQGTTGGATPGTDFGVAVLTGRVDGLYISGLLNIAWQGVYTFHGTRSGLVGDCICYISNSDFDSWNGITHTAGYFQVTNTLFSHAAGVSVSGLAVSGTNTRATISNSYFSNNSSTSTVIMQSCTTCSIQMSNIIFQEGGQAANTIGIASTAVDSTFMIDNAYVDFIAASQSFLLAQTPSSGANNIHVTNSFIHSTAGTTYTSPILSIATGNRASITNFRLSDKGAGAGTAINKAGSNFDNISGNTAPGWTYTLPGATGIYTPNI